MNWEDIEGNRLKILKNKSVQVHPAKIEARSTKDLFRKAKPALIAKHSYWVLAFFGKESKSVLSFLGNDGKLRVSYFENTLWVSNISPVLIGYSALQQVVSGYIDTDSRIISSIKIPYPKGFEIEEAWGCGYPTSDINLLERIQCHLTNPGLVA